MGLLGQLRDPLGVRRRSRASRRSRLGGRSLSKGAITYLLYSSVTPGRLIRETRRRHGLSQVRLARRVGTRQSAISRLEADEVSPTVETLEMLMRAMGERLELTAVSPERDYDPAHRQVAATRSPDERLALGISWSRMAARLARAGREARGGS